jgi:hypothetical protein
VLVDGTVCPTWDWKHLPDLYSAKAGYPGMNIQIAATLDGRLAAVGPMPVHGARHDAHAFGASGLKALLTDLSAAADLGYVGVAGIELVPTKRLSGIDLTTAQVEFNTTNVIQNEFNNALSNDYLCGRSFPDEGLIKVGVSHRATAFPGDIWSLTTEASIGPRKDRCGTSVLPG